MSPDVVGVGAINCDILFEVTPHQLETINSELDKPLISGKEDFGKSENFEQTIQTVEKHAKPIGQGLGGSAAQTIFALSKMRRFRTGYLGVVGNDDYGEFLLSSLESERVDTSRIFKEEIGSGVCISLSDGRDRALRVFPNSNDLFGFKHLALDTLEKYLSKSKIVHMTSFVCSFRDEPLAVQDEIAERINEKVRISFAPGELYVNQGLKTLQPILQNTYVLFLNRKEMQILTGEDYKEGSKKLLGLYSHLHYVVCTLGEDGSYSRYRNGEVFTESIRTPKNEIKPEGITGAGDYFVAGFLAGLLKDHPAEYCMKIGNEVASIKLKGLEREAYQKIEI